MPDGHYGSNDKGKGVASRDAVIKKRLVSAAKDTQGTEGESELERPSELVVTENIERDDDELIRQTESSWAQR